MTLDQAQEILVIEKATSCLSTANRATGSSLSLPLIVFDLRGRAAGQFRIREGAPQLRFNTAIFARYFDDNLEQTVPHEVAHYLVYELFMKKAPGRRIMPHGREWKAMMQLLGVPATTRHGFDLSDIPVRREQRLAWSCGCSTHSITKRTHLRMLRGEKRICTVCKAVLMPTGDREDD